MRECHSCAAREGEAAFMPAKRGTPHLCCDCAAAEVAHMPPGRRPAVITRARYRANLRERERAAQMDLIDPVVPRP